MQTITYRIPELNDINSLRMLFNEILDSSFPEYCPQAITAYGTAWTEEILHKRITDGKDLLLTAWLNDKPVGIVSGPPPEGGVGTIVWLLIQEKMRGAHVGSTLFKLACDYYKSIHCHKLKLTAPSQKARDFYHKVGMQEEGFHPQHWWNADYWSFGIKL